jgi:hypothetical protein
MEHMTLDDNWAVNRHTSKCPDATSQAGKARALTLEHLILNFVLVELFLIFTEVASFLRAFVRKSLISVISLGCGGRSWGGREREERIMLAPCRDVGRDPSSRPLLHAREKRQRPYHPEI